jgi:hypothetical protein
MTDNTPCKATPTATLREQVMSHNIPKSEREWWARREIERLIAEVERMTNELGSYRKVAGAAAKVMQDQLNEIASERAKVRKT